ncbi:MAG: ABC transporter permease [Tissierellia bacterium]|nr:ABC transporter permease [Tissierellia bacterium]
MMKNINYSYWISTFKAFKKNKVALFFLYIIIGLIAFITIQPFLPDQKSPNAIYVDEATGLQLINKPPSKEFWLGTNSIGQDMWARIWAGTRISLLIGFTVALWENLIGLFVGLIWGYVRKLEGIISVIYNVLNNVPKTIMLILLAYTMKPGLLTIIFIMCISGWLDSARLVRNLVVTIRDREYNIASRILGTPIYRIVSKNILPYLVSTLVLKTTLSIPAAIGYEVFLTYIGLGLPVSTPSLGNLISEGRGYIVVPSLRYQLMIPALILSTITVSFYTIGNAFADASDPKNHF